jgi:spore coat polysaccharide biosynthesis protein SpsF
MPFYENKSILEIIVEKIMIFFPHFPLIVATSNESQDDKIVKFAEDYGIDYYRGSEKNVLSRFVEASKKHNLKTVIRICADNPFLDIDSLSVLLDFHKNSQEEYDYISYKDDKNVPVIKKHYGFFCEIVKLEALQKIMQQTNDNLYLEHVTNYLYQNKSFNIKLVDLPSYLNNKSHLRFTVDDILDFNNLKMLYSQYVDLNYSLKKLLSYLKSKPDIIKDMKSNIKIHSK